MRPLHLRHRKHKGRFVYFGIDVSLFIPPLISETIPANWLQSRGMD